METKESQARAKCMLNTTIISVCIKRTDFGLPKAQNCLRVGALRVCLSTPIHSLFSWLRMLNAPRGIRENACTNYGTSSSCAATTGRNANTIVIELNHTSNALFIN